MQPESTYDTLSAGDILFNNTNSSKLVGKTAQIKENVEQAYSNRMTRIRLNTSMMNFGLISFYLHYLFLQGYFCQPIRLLIINGLAAFGGAVIVIDVIGSFFDND